MPTAETITHIKWADTFNAIGAILSAITAMVALLVSRKVSASLARQGQVANIPELYLDNYLLAKLVIPVELPDNDVPIETLAQLWEHLRENGDEFRDGSCKTGDWRYAASDELALAVQRLGLCLYVGALPLDYVLADHANSIIMAWTNCHERVMHRRVAVEHACSDNGWVPGFSREHGEWLAYTAALWLEDFARRSGRNPLRLDAFLKVVVGEKNRDAQIEELRRRVNFIYAKNPGLMAPVTRKELNRIVGKGWRTWRRRLRHAWERLRMRLPNPRKWLRSRVEPPPRKGEPRTILWERPRRPKSKPVKGGSSPNRGGT